MAAAMMIPAVPGVALSEAWEIEQSEIVGFYINFNLIDRT
jgi:hypothetical protein